MSSKKTDVVYEAGELVLCYHGPLIYEAKVLNVKTNSEGDRTYRVHYNGWKRTWDQWVKSDRMLKLNEAGLQKQSEVADQYQRGKKPVKLRCSGVPSFSERGRHEASVSPASDLLQPRSSNSTGSVSSSGRKSAASLNSDAPPATATTTTTTTAENETESVGPARKRSRPLKSTSTAATTVDVSQTTDTGVRRSKSSAAGGQSEKSRKPACSSDVDTSSQRGDQTEGAVSKKRPSAAAAATADTPSDEADRTTNTKAVISLKGNAPQLDAHVQTRRAYMHELGRDIRIEIPNDLKCWLFDEWDLVTRQHRLMSLPANVTADGALAEYVEWKRTELMKGKSKKKRAKLEKTSETSSNGDESATASSEDTDPIIDDIIVFTDGLREYFNAMLGCQLLALDQVSSIYGVPHLLRMFTRLGAALSHTTLGQDSCDNIVSMCNDFLMFLQMKRRSQDTERSIKARYFIHGDYFSAPPEYHRTT